MKKEWYNHKAAQVFFHVAAWTIFLMLPFLTRPVIIENGRTIRLPLLITENIVNCLVLAGIFYLNAYWLIPRLLNRKKKFWYIACLLIILGGSALYRYFQPPHPPDMMKRRMERLGPERHMNRPFREPKNVFFIGSVSMLPHLFMVIFMLSISASYRFIIDRVRLENLEQQRRNEHLKTELTFLRSQISPHFMFNILNSAVSLARSGSDQLEPMLIKLSGLMRYMLYDTGDEKAPLVQEIEYLESYIDLQKIRFSDDVLIEFTKTGAFFGHAIEPMLLIPFVENAFKHGIGRITDPQIVINIEQDIDLLTFKVANKFNTRRDELQDARSGIGLANVRKRLNLLYGDKYTLQVEERDEWFYINLQLMLR